MGGFKRAVPFRGQLNRVFARIEQPQVSLTAQSNISQTAHCWVSSDPIGANESDSAVLKISACSSLWMSADAVAAVHAGHVSREQSSTRQHLEAQLAQAEHAFCAKPPREGLLRQMSFSGQMQGQQQRLHEC